MAEKKWLSVAVGGDQDKIDRLQSQNDRLRDEWYPPSHMDAVWERTITPLVSALRNLRNEAAGSLHLSGVREAIGNTNYACMEQRIKEAEALLDRLEVLNRTLSKGGNDSD